MPTSVAAGRVSPAFPKAASKTSQTRPASEHVREIDHQADDVVRFIGGFERGVKIFHGLPRLITGAFVGKSAVRTPGVLSEKRPGGYDTLREELGLQVESFVLMYRSLPSYTPRKMPAGFETDDGERLLISTRQHPRHWWNGCTGQGRKGDCRLRSVQRLKSVTGSQQNPSPPQNDCDR